MDTKTETKMVNTVKISGRFDAHMVGRVQEELESYLKQQQSRVVINLEAVKFIDTRALALLVTTMKRCRQGDGDLRLCALKQSVRIIFELTKLEKAFQIFETEAEAVASFEA